jgi:hypothetical protein
MTAPVRAALYLRVSTGRQADNDLSIPDQRRQAKGYCAFASWDRKANCCVRSSPLQAQKRRVLACPVLYRSGAPEGRETQEAKTC